MTDEEQLEYAKEVDNLNDNSQKFNVEPNVLYSYHAEKDIKKGE